MPRIQKTKKDVVPVVVTGRNPDCSKCGLCKTSEADGKSLVCLWGVGDPKASIMFIGEAPGKEELVQEIPFVGKAGELFTKYLTQVGISRDSVYITNTTKCRPPDNRAPKPMELKACAPYLDYEISQVKPKVICVLGATALKRVVGVEGITKLRGKPMWSDKYSCWVVATWHPSYVLRNGELFEEVEQFKKDLKYVKAIAETGETGQLKTEYITITNLDLFEAMMIEINNAKVSSVDTETWGDYLTGKILTIQFSTKPGTGWVVPFYKTGPEFTEPTEKTWRDADEKYVLDTLKTYLENPEKKKVGQNIKYDFQFFRLYGIVLRGVIFDTMLGHYLLDENAKGQHDLGALSLKFTDMGDYSNELYQAMGMESSKIGPLSMIKAPFDVLCRYACKDVDATIRVFCVLFPTVKNQGLLPLLQRMMIPLSFVLGEMEMAGVLVDVPYYQELAKQYEAEVEIIEADLRGYPDVKFMERQQGKPVNFNSPDQMRVLFYDILKLPVYKMTNSKKKKKVKSEPKASTDKEVLERLADDHPFPKILLKHRKLSKFLGTYVKPIPELVKSDGRLHTSYQQHITVTGRLSSSKPNLQNIPKREPEMAIQIRRGIVAPPGYKLIESDLGQIEFRLWANESQDPTMLADLSDSKMDIHKKIASLAFSMPVDQVTPEIREKAKTIVYSVIYGKGEENLAKETGLTVDQVKAVFDAIFKRYPKAKAWMDATAKRAETTGEVINWAGRRRRLADGFKSGIQGLMAEARRQAINSPIQGGAHDILTIAALKIRQELFNRGLKSRLVMNIHDSLILEVKDEELDEVVRLVKQKMEEGLPKITVPLITDISVGDRLGEMKKLPKEYFANA